MALFDGILRKLGFRKSKVNVLVVGLDNSGKTTIIKRLQAGSSGSTDVETVAPTVGFNVERFKRGKLEVTAIDMSGANKYRHLWEEYYSHAQAIVFVVDSSDQLRLCVAKDELDMLLSHQRVGKDVPVLFFANKKDVASSLPPVDIADSLQLEAISRPWQIVPSDALTGDGLESGFNWLTEQLEKR